MCVCMFDHSSPSSFQVVIGLDDRWTLKLQFLFQLVSFNLALRHCVTGLFAFFSLALSIAVQTPKNAETLQAKSEKSSPLKQRSVIVVGTTGMKRSGNEVS